MIAKRIFLIIILVPISIFVAVKLFCLASYLYWNLMAWQGPNYLENLKNKVENLSSDVLLKKNS